MKKILILYTSKYGSTEKCAYKIKEKLKIVSDIVNLSYNIIKNLADYDKIIIGTPIYSGKINKNLKKFFEKEIDDLKDKILYFFCLALQQEKIEKYVLQIPQILHNQILIKECFGAKVFKNNLTNFEKIQIKLFENKLKKDLLNYNSISDEKIDLFCRNIEKN